MKKFTFALALAVISLVMLGQASVRSEYIESESDSVILFTEYNHVGRTESFSIVSDIPLKAARPLGSIVLLIGLDQVKSVKLPENGIAIVYKVQDINKYVDKAQPVTILKKTEPFLPTPLLPVEGGYAFVIGSAMCDPPCSISGGICSLNSRKEPYCRCAKGFTGKACENCVTGHYGTMCTPCKAVTEVLGSHFTCDDGVQGSGDMKCSYGYSDVHYCRMCDLGFVGIKRRTCEVCDCGTYGECRDAPGQCICVVGRETSDPEHPCEACIPGMFATRAGCEACWSGCEECGSPSGKCAKCSNGYKIDPNDERKCVPDENVEQCPEGEYLFDGKCLSCPTQCKSCYNFEQCKECANPDEHPLPSSLPDGAICGKLSKGEGVSRCLSAAGSSSGTQVENAIGIYNEQKNKCELCMPGCTDCTINPSKKLDPSSEDYSSQLLDSMDCLKCTSKYAIFEVNKQKVCRKARCGSYFVRDYKGHCVVADSHASITSSGMILWDADKKSIKDMSCGEGSYLSAFLTCKKCHPDCETCIGPGASSCASCRPGTVMENSRCVRHCAEGFFEDAKSRSCLACPRGCKYCTETGICTGCIERYTLDRDVCRYSLFATAEDNSNSLVWVGYVGAGVAGLFFLSTGIIKVASVRKKKITKRYDDWGKRSVDSRIKILASTGALQNIGIGTNTTDTSGVI